MGSTMEESNGLLPVEVRYYDTVLRVTKDLLAEHEDLYKDSELPLKFAELHSGMNAYSTINHVNALDFWTKKIRGDEDLFRFVQRASTASRFLSSITWAEWSILAMQLSLAIHPGNRSVYVDGYIDDCTSIGGNLLENKISEYVPAVDKTIVDRTDIKSTFNVLVATPWLVWLYVASLIPIQAFEINRKRSRRSPSVS